MTEDQLTTACANYLRAKYPNILFTHIANERKTSKARGAKLKRMGVRKGVADFMIYYPCGGFAGLILELKTEKLTDVKDGKPIYRRASYPSPSQREFLRYCSSVNYACDVVWNLDEFISTVDSYFSGEFKPSEYMSKNIIQSPEHHDA